MCKQQKGWSQCSDLGLKVSEMMKWVEVSATMYNDLSLSPAIHHGGRREPTPANCPLITHMLWHAHLKNK